jgi:hypothetical protein
VTSGVADSAGRPMTAVVQSVFFGCPVPASLIQQVRVSWSTRYQMRPPPVTSYYHCASTLPACESVASDPLSW